MLGIFVHVINEITREMKLYLLNKMVYTYRVDI